MTKTTLQKGIEHLELDTNTYAYAYEHECEYNNKKGNLTSEKVATEISTRYSPLELPSVSNPVYSLVY